MLLRLAKNSPGCLALRHISVLISLAIQTNFNQYGFAAAYQGFARFGGSDFFAKGLDALMECMPLKSFTFSVIIS